MNFKSEVFYLITYHRNEGFWCPVNNSHITHLEVARKEATKYRERGVLGAVRIEKHTRSVEVVE